MPGLILKTYIAVNDFGAVPLCSIRFRNLGFGRRPEAEEGEQRAQESSRERNWDYSIGAGADNTIHLYTLRYVV